MLKILHVRNSGKTDDLFAQYRSALGELGIKTIEDLEALVNPIIRTTTKIEVQKASRLPDNAQILSHFGGQPYFEQGDKWPTTKTGKPLKKAKFCEIVFTTTQSLPDWERIEFALQCH